MNCAYGEPFSKAEMRAGKACGLEQELLLVFICQSPVRKYAPRINDRNVQVYTATAAPLADQSYPAPLHPNCDRFISNPFVKDHSEISIPNRSLNNWYFALAR
jgi:hypothetical protein